jgi:acyl-CoA thioesterase-1
MRKWFAVTVGMVLLVSGLGCKPEPTNKQQEDSNGMATALPTERAASAPTSDLEKQSTPDGRRVIVCFGDSLTAGYGVDPEESYPSRLQADLDHEGYHYRVVNMGISGETTKDGLARVDRVIAIKPAIAVVEFGGNDGLRGVPISSSRANLDAIVARLRSAGVQVMLAGITLPPQFSSDYIHQFNDTYTLVAKKYNVPLYPFLLKDVYGIPGSIQQDGIHPTAQGCQQVARNVAGFLQPKLTK